MPKRNHAVFSTASSVVYTNFEIRIETLKTTAANHLQKQFKEFSGDSSETNFNRNDSPGYETYHSVQLDSKKDRMSFDMLDLQNCKPTYQQERCDFALYVCFTVW